MTTSVPTPVSTVPITGTTVPSVPVNPAEMFNNFLNQIQKAQSSILCDSECQRINAEESLKLSYDNAKVNALKAPANVQTTFKDYYSFKNGPAGYYNYMEKTHNDNANKMINTFKLNIDKQINNIMKSLETYNSSLAAFTNISPAFYQYHRENNFLQKNIKTNIDSTITNERKTGYEESGLSALYSTRTWIQLFYGLLGCIMLFGLWGMNNGIGITKKIIVTIITIVFPFIITNVSQFLYNVYIWIIGLFPTNMYLQHKQ